MGSRAFFSRKSTWVIFFAVITAASVILILLLQGRVPKKPGDMTLGDYTYAIEYSDYQIKAAMKKHKIPGIIFAMVDSGNVIFSEAYGYADVENNFEATPATIFKAGSISKVFTGIEVMRLHEEGLIDITRPLKDYLPEFNISSRFMEAEPISIERLLTHRSGLPRGGTMYLWDWSSRPLVLDAQVKSLQESHMVYPVGYRYKYSNIGYNTLARMIERVKGLEPPAENTAGAFPYYMMENFFKPLGMHDTNFGSTELMYGTQSRNPVAMGYYREKGRNIPYNQFDIISMASGNVHTTLNDMTGFLMTLLTAEDEGIITKSLLDAMYYHKSDNSRDLKENGLTWFRNSEILGETVVFHDGTNQGFISMLAMLPEHGLGIIIMANSDEFENVKSVISFDILRVMLEAKTGKSIPDLPESKTVTLPEDTLKSYTGKYLMNDDIIEIIFRNGKLKAKFKGFGLNLQPIGDNLFTISNPMADSVQTRISFYPPNDIDGAYMILEMGDSFFCPRYPAMEEVPETWQMLEGKYSRYARHISHYVESGSLGDHEISVKNGILMLEGSFALLPVEDNRVLIQGGVFHGETMEYEPDTGEITWQMNIYRPVSYD